MENSEELLIPRLQFELRFTNLLNFKSIIEDIGAPFIKLTSGFSITSKSPQDTFLKLIFEEDSYYIDCRWDRLILVSDGTIDFFSNTNSAPIKMFFEFLDILKGEKSFGNFIYCILQVYFLNQKYTGYEDILDSYKKFITDDVKSILPGYNDFAIHPDKRINDRNISVVFGPLNEIDLERRDLFPFNKSLKSQKPLNGNLVEVSFSEKIKSYKQNIFKNAFEEVLKYKTVI